MISKRKDEAMKIYEVCICNTACLLYEADSPKMAIEIASRPYPELNIDNEFEAFLFEGDTGGRLVKKVSQRRRGRKGDE